MAKTTTVKPIGLGYRDVASSDDYTKLMGVLKGLTIGQDDPDSTEVEAEFYDSPFDIFYDGKPVTMSFELANYDLEELEPLFGGEYDSSTNTYDGATNAFTSEHEWKLDFGRGNASLVIVRGLTIGTLKKDADGALNFNVTITALVHNDGEDDHMYQIVGVTPETNTIISVNGHTAGSQAVTAEVLAGQESNSIVLSRDVTTLGAITFHATDSAIMSVTGATLSDARTISYLNQTGWGSDMLRTIASVDVVADGQTMAITFATS